MAYKPNRKQIPVVIPKSVNKKIIAMAAKQYIPRNTWILNAIQEKIDRDKNQSATGEGMNDETG